MQIKGLRRTSLAILVVSCVAGTAVADGSPMTGADLQALLADGKTIVLGGPGEGYAGTLTLNADGTGSGTADTDAGAHLTLTGTWRIEGDQFCRLWQEFDDGNEVCETWVLVKPGKVDVMVGDKKVGVNSW